MGFGTEVLFMIALGLVVLGPKRLHAMLGHVARGMKSQLAAELEVASLDEKTDGSPQLAGEQ